MGKTTHKKKRLKRRVRLLESRIHQLRARCDGPASSNVDEAKTTRPVLSAPEVVAEGARLDLIETLDVTAIEGKVFGQIVDQGYLAAYSIVNIELLIAWFKELAELGVHKRGHPNGVARYLFAKSLANELHTFLRSMQQIARLLDGAVPGVDREISKLANRYPDLKRVRDSIAHSRERLAGEGNLNRDPIEGRLQLGVLDENTLTYTDAKGDAKLEITDKLLDDVSQCFLLVFKKLPTL